MEVVKEQEIQEETMQAQVQEVDTTDYSTTDYSTIDRPALLTEMETLQAEIKQRQDVVLEKAKVLEKAIEWNAKEVITKFQNKDIKDYTPEDWTWVLSEGELDDRSQSKFEFKKSILFSKFGFMIEKWWKYTNQSALSISKVFFKVPDFSTVDRIKQICQYYKPLKSFFDQEEVCVFQIQDKRNSEAGMYYFEYNKVTEKARITKIYHNASTEPKPYDTLENILKEVEKISA